MLLSTAPAQILLVDDNNLSRYSLRRLIEAAGHQVTEAACGQEGLQLALSALPDLVILDINLPDISGWEVLRQMRESPAIAHLSILMLSGEQIDTESVVRSLEQGADAFLPHPVENTVLLSTIRALLRARRASQQAEQRADDLAAVLAATPGPLIVYDAAGNPAQANPAVVELYGVDPVGLARAEFVRRLDVRRLDGAPVAVDDLPSSRALRGEIVKNEHYLFTNAHGQQFIILASTRPIWQGDTVRGCVAIWQDVTEIKQAEAALERYQLLSEYARDIILFVRRDGQIIEANQAALAAYGYTRDELLSLKVTDLRTPASVQNLDQQLAAADREGLYFETLHRRKDGSTLPVEVNSQGADIGGERMLLSIVRDITDRNQAEAALRQSEARVRQKLDNILSPEGDVGTLELDDIIDVPAIQSLMDNFYQLVQIPLAIIDLNGKVLVGKGWSEICTGFHRIHPESCGHCIESDVQLTSGISPGEYKLYKCKNNMWDVASPIMVGSQHVGNIFTGQFFFDDEPIDYELFRAQARQYGFDEAAYIAALDAVPRLARETIETDMAFLIKLAEMISLLSYSNIKLARSLAQSDALMASLQESQADLNRAQAVAHAGSWRLNVRQDELLWSDETYRIFDIPTGTAMTYEDFLAKIHPEDREYLDRHWRAALQGAEYDIEHRIVVGDAVKWVREKAELEFDPAGALLGGFGTVQDITERKRMEQALAREANLLATIQQSVPNGLAYLDCELRFVQANPVYANYIGLSREQIIGRLHEEVFPQSEDIREHIRQVMRSGVPISHREQPRLMFYRNDVETLYFDLDLIPVKDHEGQVIGIIISSVDITDKVTQREQLLAVERTRAEMAEMLNAEINHRMKNNLLLISGVLQMQALREETDSPVTEALLEATSRIAALSSVHEQMYQTHVDSTDLQYVLQRVVDLAQGALSSHETEVTVEACSLPVNSRAGSAVAIMANELITNALKHGAPDSDGKCRLSVQLAVDSEWAWLRVWNSGNPVPADFDINGQSGLGLQLVRELVNGQFKGQIAIYSQAGGTMCEVSFGLVGLK